MKIYLIFVSLIIFNSTDGELSNEYQCALKSVNNRSHFFVMFNNSCYIPPNTNRKNDFSSFQKFYERAGNQLTLFRIVSGTGIRSYTLFTDINIYHQSINRNHSENFKSILLNHWDEIRPIYMNVTIRNVNDNIEAWLLFCVNEDNDVMSWFSRNNLLKSFPWDIVALMKSTFNYFSIRGLETSN